MNKQELNFYIKEEWNKIARTLRYFILEPWFIFRRWISGKYTPMLVFWFTFILFIIMWRKGIFGRFLKSMGILVFLTFFYMFYRSGKVEEYYRTEYLEGKKIE